MPGREELEAIRSGVVEEELGLSPRYVTVVTDVKKRCHPLLIVT